MSFTIRNVAKAARYSCKWSKTVCVKFPASDYMVAGRVWSGEPVRCLKPTFKGEKVLVRFNNSIWELSAHAWVVSNYDEASRKFLPVRRSDGRRYKAQISFTPNHIRDLK